MGFVYIEKVLRMLQDIETKEEKSLKDAIALMTECILKGNSIYCFGTGHAAMICQELYYRAGSLLLINPIFAPGLSADIEPVTLSTDLERLEGYGTLIANKKADFQPGDVLIVHSVSGRNPAVIEMALAAKAKGAKVIAITSANVSKDLKSRHSSGLRLFETADTVIDNHVEKGDAAVAIEGLEQKAGSTSTIAAAAIAQILQTETVRALKEQGMEEVPVLQSANIEGGDAHNQKLFEKWKKQIHYKP
jgi:uncharacterized phosphosugar-binding protein